MIYFIPLILGTVFKYREIYNFFFLKIIITSEADVNEEKKLFWMQPKKK